MNHDVPKDVPDYVRFCNTCGMRPEHLPDCPGKQIRKRTQDLIIRGSLTYRDGQWIILNREDYYRTMNRNVKS